MERGKAAENAAARFLAGQGLRLVERNWRCKMGEIDLIVRDGGTLVFVEVRARSGMGFGGAAASITAGKQSRIIRSAQLYLSALRSHPACRFDVVLLDGPKLSWIRDAFQADG